MSRRSKLLFLMSASIGAITIATGCTRMEVSKARLNSASQGPGAIEPTPEPEPPKPVPLHRYYSAYTFNSADDYEADPGIEIQPRQAARLLPLETAAPSFLPEATFSGTTVVGGADGTLTIDPSKGFAPSVSKILPHKSTSLVAHWPFDGRSVQNSANNAYWLLAHGWQIISFTPFARVGNFALHLPENEGFAIQNSANRISLNRFTRYAWIKLNAAPKSPLRILSYDDGETSISMEITPDLRLGAADSYGTPQNNETNPESIATNEKLTIGSWHQVAIVRDIVEGKSYLHFYIDGAKRQPIVNGEPQNFFGPAPAHELNPTSPLRLGGSAMEPTEALDQYHVIDDIALWTDALTTSEIKLIYDRQRARYQGSYVSRVYDQIAKNAIWTSLTPVMSLPFMKPLPQPYMEDPKKYSASSQVLLPALIGTWHFEEAPSEDMIFQGSNGLMAKSYTSLNQNVDAPLSRGIELSRRNQQCLESQANFGNGFTISAWIRINHGDAEHTLISNTNGSDTNSGFKILINSPDRQDGIVRLVTGDGAKSFSTQTTVAPIAPGQWHHLAVAVDKLDGSADIFVNGRLANSGLRTTALNFKSSGPMSIGCQLNREPSFYDGALDELALWNRALTQTEIIQIYRRTANRVKYQVRSCPFDSCQEKWLGPDGTDETYFSQTLINPDSFNSPTLVFDDLATTRPLVKPNQYFQYRVFMESDDLNDLCAGKPCLPDLASLTVAPRAIFSGSRPGITTKASTRLTHVLEITKTDFPTGCTSHQVSMDDGSTWRYWNSAIGGWQTTEEGAFHSSSLGDINAHLQELGSGDFKIKTFLNRSVDGSSTQCTLDELGVTYAAPVTTAVDRLSLIKANIKTWLESR